MLKEHKNLKVFKAFGFNYVGDSGKDQVYGNCPFCGEEKFYANPETKKWDCKSCKPKGGGYQTFLKDVYSKAKESTTDKDLMRLSVKKKGVRLKTLKYFGVVYLDTIGKFLLPTWDTEKNELFNLRIYDFKTNNLLNAPGCKTLLYNLWHLPNDYLSIYLVEGEWDAMIMHQLIEANELDRTVVLAVPGANVFKENWSFYFRNKIVHVIYDNDYDKVKNQTLVKGAGKLGQRKVQNVLGRTPKQIDFINWLGKHPDKYDLRDLYNARKQNAKKVMKVVVALLSDAPMPIIAPEGYEDQAEEGSKIIIPEFTGEGLFYEDVYKGYTKWLELDDLHCLDAMFGTVIANRYQGDPVWLFLVASSGGTKSELIMSLEDAPLIYSLSSITPTTLVSGSAASGGGDPSLIPKLDKHILCIKDFTVMLDMAQQSRDAIVSQLRDAYDGKCAKGFGTGAERHYDSKFGMVAGVTPIIEVYLQGGSAMGERFLSFYLKEDSSYNANKRIMRKALGNILGGRKDDMRGELQEVAQQVLNYDFGGQPDLHDELQEQLFAISQWTSIMRGTVPRDKYTREVTRKALIEKPTRLITQFAKLTLGITKFRYKDHVSKDEIDLVSRTALGTVPHHLSNVVQLICRTNLDGRFTEESLAKKIRLPLEAVRKSIEDLYYLGILDCKRFGQMTKEYYLAKEAKELINIGNLYERKSRWQKSKLKTTKPKRKIRLKKKA